MPCQAARNSTLMPEAKSFNLKVTGIMKKLFYSLAVLAAVTACNKEIEQQPAPVVGEGVDFIATFEGADTRVYLGDDYFYRWEAGDPVSVFTGSNHDQYKAASGDVVETTLEYVSTTATLGSTLSENYAVYPYNAANTIENGVISTTLPAEQTYNPAVPTGINNAIMVSKASGTEFVFKNSCALVKVNLKIAEDFVGLHSVKSIRVSSKKHPLSGAATINVAGGDYTAKVKATPKATEGAVTLIGCEAAGKLQNESAMTFYLAIPAGAYEAGDLSISVLTSTSSVPFNETFTLKNNYTVNRSQYIEVSATMAKGYEWFEQKDDEIIIKDNVVLVNKAIMNHTENLIKQGFDDQGSIETIFDVPDHPMVIRGEDLYGEGAVEGQDGRPTITFTTTDDEAFIMNTFTSLTSGLSNGTPHQITLENLRMTGEFRTNTAGIYVTDKWNEGDLKYHQAYFNSLWTNVDIADCEILPYTVNDQVQIGAALCVYGTAIFNDCNFYGVKWSDKAQNVEGVDLYDVACPNLTKVTINGGKTSSIYGWEQSQVTFDNNVEVDLAYTINISAKPEWRWTVKKAVVKTFVVDPHTTWNPNVLITADAKIETLKFLDDFKSSETEEALFDKGYWASVAVNPSADIEKVVVGEDEMTLSEFISKYSIKATL